MLLFLFSGNLPKDTREKDLERFFRNYGRLRDVLVKPGYGFVEFEDHRLDQSFFFAKNSWPFINDLNVIVFKIFHIKIDLKKLEMYQVEYSGLFHIRNPAWYQKRIWRRLLFKIV